MQNFDMNHRITKTQTSLKKCIYKRIMKKPIYDIINTSEISKNENINYYYNYCINSSILENEDGVLRFVSICDDINDNVFDNILKNNPDDITDIIKYSSNFILKQICKIKPKDMFYADSDYNINDKIISRKKIYDEICQFINPDFVTENYLNKFNSSIDYIIKNDVNNILVDNKISSGTIEDIHIEPKTKNLPDPHFFIKKFIWKLYYNPCNNYIKYIFNPSFVSDGFVELLYVFLYSKNCQYKDIKKLHKTNNQHLNNYIHENYPEMLSIPLNIDTFNIIEMVDIYKNFLSFIDAKEINNLKLIDVNNLYCNDLPYIFEQLSFYHKNYTLKNISHTKTQPGDHNSAYKLRNIPNKKDFTPY